MFKVLVKINHPKSDFSANLRNIKVIHSAKCVPEGKVRFQEVESRREALLHTKFSSFHMVHMIEIVRQGKVDFPQVIVSEI